MGSSAVTEKALNPCFLVPRTLKNRGTAWPNGFSV